VLSVEHVETAALAVASDVGQEAKPAVGGRKWRARPSPAAGGEFAPPCRPARHQARPVWRARRSRARARGASPRRGTSATRARPCRAKAPRPTRAARAGRSTTTPASSTEPSAARVSSRCTKASHAALQSRVGATSTCLRRPALCIAMGSGSRRQAMAPVEWEKGRATVACRATMSSKAAAAGRESDTYEWQIRAL